jgi:hypothetical protein
MSSQPFVTPRGTVRQIQIINASLILGPAIFLGIVIFQTQDQLPIEPQMTYYALGFTALMIVIYAFFRLPVNKHRLKQMFQDQSFDPQSDEAFLALAPTYMTERIIRLAQIESAAFFSGIVYMQEKVWWSLAAAGLVIFLMLVGFPTRSQIDAWIERRTVGLRFGDSEL